MRSQYQPSERVYDGYFASQRGHGLPYFAGAHVQRGHGLGGLFKSLGAALLPVLKSGAKFAGKELLSSGGQVISDVLEGRNVMDSLRQRGKQGLHRVARGAATAIKRRGPPITATSKRRKARRQPERAGDVFD
jgi:hypothetical protein